MQRSSNTFRKPLKNSENKDYAELRKAIDALWSQEAEDRIDAFERGEMTAIPAEEVFAEIEKKRL